MEEGLVGTYASLSLPKLKTEPGILGNSCFKDDLVALSPVSTHGYPPSSNFLSIMAQRPAQSRLRPEGQYLPGQKDVAPGDKQKEIMIQHPWPERLFSFFAHDAVTILGCFEALASITTCQQRLSGFEPCQHLCMAMIFTISWKLHDDERCPNHRLFPESTHVSSLNSSNFTGRQKQFKQNISNTACQTLHSKTYFSQKHKKTNAIR